MKIEANDWWPDMVRLKDELSLRELGERFGVSAGAVMAAFRRNGIERTPAPSGPRKSRRSATGRAGPEDLPPEPGDEFPGAKKVGAGSRSRSARRSSIEPYADLVGTVPDRVVAEKAGVTVSAVGAWRRARGVPAFGRSSAPSTVGAARSAMSIESPSTVHQPSVTHAWKVVLGDGSSGVVLAKSVVQAATLAEGAGRAISVKLVGVLL